MNRQLLSKVIQRKRGALRTFRVEQAGIAGFIGGFVGLLLGGVYTPGLIWHIANVFLYAMIGAVIGYFNSNNKKEELQVELMMLESFERNRNT